MFDKMRTMEREHDHIRRILLCEPRGSVIRHVNLLEPATRPDCDVGAIIMEPTEYVPMSGSNTICTVTVLLETGIVAMREPQTVLMLDTPGGRPRHRGGPRSRQVRLGRVRERSLFRRPLDAEIQVEGLGACRGRRRLRRDVLAIVDAKVLGFRIVPSEARAAR